MQQCVRDVAEYLATLNKEDFISASRDLAQDGDITFEYAVRLELERLGKCPECVSSETHSEYCDEYDMDVTVCSGCEYVYSV